jgi:hypothetical protein
MRRRDIATRNLREQANQLVQGNAAATGDVERPGLAGFARANVRIDHVLHKGEVSALFTVSINGRG